MVETSSSIDGRSSSSPIEFNSWKLSHQSKIHSSPPVDNDRYWLERHEHSPSKVIVSPDGQKVFCMAKSNQLTISDQLLEDNHQGIKFQAAKHIVQCRQAITCIAFGYCQYVSIGGGRRNQSLEDEIDFVPILVTGHINGDIQIWNANCSTLITRLISHSNSVTEMIVSSDFGDQMQILSVSTDRKVKVWDFERPGFNMSQTLTLPCPLHCLALSPNGKMVAFGGSSHKIYVHHKVCGGAIQHPAVKQLSGHLHNIVSLKFLPDNAILISASLDGRLLMWDPMSGEIKQMISMHFPLPSYVFPSQVTGLDVSRFGHAIVNLSDKGHLFLWNLLSMEGRVNEPDCVLNITPSDEINIGEEASFRSVAFVKAEKYLLVPEFNSSRTHVVRVNVPAPSLKHLCRLVIRSLIPNSAHLPKLRLPSKLAKYLSYNTWV